VVVITGTALAGAVENDSSAENANGIPENVAKVKRANVPFRTLRIRCFSCQIARRSVHNYQENFTGFIPLDTFQIVNEK
jgi:hypothetical protein